MNSPRNRLPLVSSGVPLLLAASLAGCAAWGNGQQSTRETERTREAERRVCLMQPPTQIEACLRRVEEDYVARQGMRQVEKRETPSEPVEEVAPAR